MLCCLFWSLSPQALTPRQMYKPCTLATHFGWEISEEIAGPRKNLPSRLSSPLELCPNPLALLFELPASHCIEHSLPLRGGWITQASLPQAPLKEFPSFPTASELSFVVSPISLASLLSKGEHSEDSQGLGGRHKAARVRGCIHSRQAGPGSSVLSSHHHPACRGGQAGSRQPGLQ